ncbi:MAG: rhodanese-like domain-containing protein [Actinobacteria bacterium]|nr:MAG: rhodanese-like domain-containing protein [Actinomycetota bacterium]
MNTKTILWVVIAALVVGIGYLAFKPSGGGVSNVDAAGLVEAQKSGAQVVDVRTPSEFQLGHIPGAVNVPVDQIQAQSASWDKNATYVIYCASGARSQIAVDLLKAAGFANLKHFNTGIQAWTGQLEKGEASTGQKIETSGKPVVVEFYTDS